MPKKRLDVLIPSDIYVRFKRIYRFRGEVTAFIVRKMEEAVIEAERRRLDGQTQSSDRAGPIRDVTRSTHPKACSGTCKDKSGTHTCECDKESERDQSSEDCDPQEEGDK